MQIQLKKQNFIRQHYMIFFFSFFPEEEQRKQSSFHFFSIDQYRACKQMEALYPAPLLYAKCTGPASSIILKTN